MTKSGFATYPSLVDRTIFITGGATGIGASLVEHFVRQGAKVGFNDIDAPAGAALAARMELSAAEGDEDAGTPGLDADAQMMRLWARGRRQRSCNHPHEAPRSGQNVIRSRRLVRRLLSNSDSLNDYPDQDRRLAKRLARIAPHPQATAIP